MKCTKCNNDKFFHYSMYRVTEQVFLTKEGKKIITNAEDIVNALPMEHINEFKCMKCGSVYSIGNNKGDEVLGLLE